MKNRLQCNPWNCPDGIKCLGGLFFQPWGSGHDERREKYLLWRISKGAFTPDANESNKLRYLRVVGRLNILSLLTSFAREIHYTTDANSCHGRGFCQAAPVSLQNVFLFL